MSMLRLGVGVNMASLAIPLSLVALLFGNVGAVTVGIIVEDKFQLAHLSSDVTNMIGQYFNMTNVDYNNDKVQLLWRRLGLTNGVYASHTVCDLVSQNVHGLITALPCRSQKYVMSQVDMFHLPHLAVSTEPCDDAVAGMYTLHVTPEHRLQSQLLADIVAKTGWATVGLIFDTALDSVLRNEIIRSMTDMAVETTLISVSSCQDSLYKLQRSLSKNMLVWTQPETMLSIFNMARALQITTSEYSWVVFIDDISLETANQIFRTIPSSNTLLVQRERSKMAVCKPDAQSSECTEFTIFQQTLADAILYYHAASIDEIRNSSASDPNVKCFSKDTPSLPWGSKLMAELRATNLAGFTKTRGFDHSGFPLTVEYRLYGIQYESDSIGWLGAWTNDNGLQLPGGKLFTNRFQSFGNKLINVTTLQEDPFVVKQTVGNETVFTGFAFDILNELAQRLQFRYRVLEPEDPRYGVQEEGGSWNGMIGKVIKGNVAMAVGPFAITSAREEDVDFTSPFWEDSFGILTLKSQSETGKLFQMMKPFTTDVWVSIAAAMVVVALVSFLSSYYSPYTEWRRDSTNVSKREASLKENFWIIYSSVIEQGPSFHPSGISSRCILGFWWLFTILIVSTYTANLAAFLTVVDVSSTINNLDELLAEREIGILLQDGGNVMTVFKKSNNDLYKRVWEKIQRSPSVNGIEEALEYVKTGKYAYIGMKSILDHTAAKSCGMYAVSKETFNSGTFGFVIPENAPYREVASYNIMKMLEGGLVDNWQQRWWPRVYNCSSEQNARTGSATSLRLDSLGGLFIVYCAITAVGFVSLLLEIVVRRCNPPAAPK